MSDPYAGIGAPDPYAGLGAPAAASQAPQQAEADLTKTDPATARQALVKAKAHLSAQISNLPSKAQQVGWDHFNHDPHIVALRTAATAPDYGGFDLVKSKLTMGLTDKAFAVVNAAIDTARGAKFGDAYHARQAQVDEARANYQAQHPGVDWATLPVNLMGGGALGGVEKATLGGLAKIGALTGAVAGVGNSRGSLGQQAAQTGISALGGAVLAPATGAAAPHVLRGSEAAAGGLANMVRKVAGREPVAAPSRSGEILLKTLADQGQTPNQAAAIMQDAHASGVPLALMDTGDETRGLASALARKPGPSRGMIRDVVVPRQEGQAERVQSAMARDLGPTANVRAASEDLMQQAKDAAQPLYQQAYNNPPVSSPKLDKILETPAGRQAVARAYTIAANEMRDPKALGFVLDKNGQGVLSPTVTLGEAEDGALTASREPLMQRSLSPQTLDYVKRGLDDIIESHRDPTTGRLRLDEGLRAINGVKSQLLNEVDRLNPAYAAARQAYAGPAAMTTALRKGSLIVNKDAETIWAETRDLTPPEMEQYKLGARSALSKMVEGRTDAADKIAALVNTPKKRKVLSYLFGGEKSFARFLSTLAQESRAAATHARVNTGSPTAANLADDTNLSGLGGIAANAAGRAIKGHGIVSNGIATLSDMVKYGAGKSGERLRSELAAGLSETDPLAWREAIKSARRAAASKRVNHTKFDKSGRVGGLLGGRVGGSLADMIAPNN